MKAAREAGDPVAAGGCTGRGALWHPHGAAAEAGDAQCHQPGGRSQGQQQPVQEKFMLSHCRKMRNTLQDFTERLCRRGEQSHHQELRHATGPATTPQLPAEHRGDCPVWNTLRCRSTAVSSSSSSALFNRTQGREQEGQDPNRPRLTPLTPA